jgi:hydrogenase nickel incorporation protein HypA/HybF
VVPDTLEFSWTLVAPAVGLEDVDLAVEYVPAVVECCDCGGRTTLANPIFTCDRCGGGDVVLIAGDEFLLVAIELTEG